MNAQEARDLATGNSDLLNRQSNILSKIYDDINGAAIQGALHTYVDFNFIQHFNSNMWGNIRSILKAQGYQLMLHNSGLSIKIIWRKE